MKAAHWFIALNVSNLKTAEAYYRRLFEMRLITREAQLDDGLWYSLRPGKGWVDAEAAGIEIDMLALRRGAFILALFRGDPTPGQVYAIGVQMPSEDLASIRERLGEDEEVIDDEDDYAHFRDMYGFVWQLSLLGTEFLSNGESRGRWLDA